MRTKKQAASLAAKWDRSRELARIGAASGARYPGWEQVSNLEGDVLTGPIRSLEDALAKLQAIELSFLAGERTDGADVSALRQTISWLSSHAQAA